MINHHAHKKFSKTGKDFRQKWLRRPSIDRQAKDGTAERNTTSDLSLARPVTPTLAARGSHGDDLCLSCRSHSRVDGGVDCGGDGGWDLNRGGHSDCRWDWLDDSRDDGRGDGRGADADTDGRHGVVEGCRLDDGRWHRDSRELSDWDCDWNTDLDGRGHSHS